MLEGELVRLLAVNETDTLKTSQPLLQLSGGDSTATLRVSYDFLANLGAAQAGLMRHHPAPPAGASSRRPSASGRRR